MVDSAMLQSNEGFTRLVVDNLDRKADFEEQLDVIKARLRAGENVDGLKYVDV